MFKATKFHLDTLLLVCGLLVAIASHFGRWHWVADALSHFALQYAVLLSILAIWFVLRRRWLATGLATLLAFSQLLLLAPLWKKQESQGLKTTHLSLLQFNIHYNHQEPERVVDWLLVQREQADVIVLLEVSDLWRNKLSPLHETHHFYAMETAESPFGVAVFSRIPLTKLRIVSEPRLRLRYGYARGKAASGVPFALFAIHPVPPLGEDLWRLQRRQLTRIAELVQKEDCKVIVAGDLNATPWSYSFQNFMSEAGLNDAGEGYGYAPTWPGGNFNMVGIPIDHTFVSTGISVLKRQVGPDLGSDHRPVLTTIAMPLTQAY